MFSNSYQSGTHVELYNTQNKDLVKNWKLTGKITKEYDPSLKGYVNFMDNGAKMTIPSNDKESLGIVQSYIVFQFCLFSPKSFSVEIAISDTTKTKRRLMFSSCTKDVVVNPLHCRIPMGKIPIGEWVNLSFDILSFVSECFKSQTFRSIDHISLSGNCKIKRVFSMRSPLVESNTIQINSEFKLEYAEMLPKSLQICIGHTDINMNIDRVKSRNNETSFDQGDNNVMIANANVKPTSNVIPSNMVGFGYNPNPLNHKNSPQMSGNEKNLKSKSQMKELRNKQEFLKVPQKQKWKPPHKVSPVKKMDTNKSDSNGRKLLNTLKHMDKWESIDANGNVNGSGHDSIEEIYDIDEHRHSPVKEMTTHTVAKNETEENYYYDIPIKKKSEYKDSSNNFTRKTNSNFNDDIGKQKVIEEILKESENSILVLEKNSRPYTPPITKLIPKQNEGDSNLLVKDGHNNHHDLIFDHVLGCYYDPRTNIYYELNND